MREVLAVLGSPRKLGNSEIMAKEISRNMPEPHELQLLRMAEFNLEPCKGCYRCLSKGRCVINDDFHTVADAVVAADALIGISPTYFLGPNATMKRFTDRGLALYSQARELWGKPAVAVGIAGIEGKEGYTLLGLENFLKMIFSQIKASKVIYGALPGEIFMNDHNRMVAVELANGLFADQTAIEEPSCPVCGGQTFRFLGNNRVRCMLCSNAGTIAMKNGVPEFAINRSKHEMFLSLKDALDHKEWLVGMKSRFLAQKSQLKEICLDFRKQGSWIKPLEKV